MEVVDLFCGIGGFSEGARQAGGNVALAVDADPGILETHRRNHPTCRHLQRVLPADDLPLPCDGREWHLHASPPCQKLSQSNRRVQEHERDSAVRLIEWYFDLVESSQPTTWSFEQVVTPLIVALLEQRRARKQALFAFVIVNCAEYDVPQDRRRLIAGSPAVVSRFVARKSSAARAVNDVIDPTPSSWLMNHTTNTPDRRGGHRPLRPEEHMRPVTMPAYTVMASATMRWVEEDGTLVRRLTPREAACLQTFPHDYFIGNGSMTAQRVGIGNAVPVEVAKRMMVPSH